MRNIRGLPTENELAGMIAMVLTEHSQTPEELNVTFSRVTSLWTDLARQHLELGPFEAAAYLFIRVQFGDIWPPDIELTKAVVARYLDACQMEREARVIRGLNADELLDMTGAGQVDVMREIYERVVTELRLTRPGTTRITLDEDVFPLATVVDKVAAVGCSSSALGNEGREGASEIVSAVVETLREIGFGEVRYPIDHERNPGLAEERCRRWSQDVRDIDLYVGIVLASSSGVTAEMYEVSDHGGQVLVAMPRGLAEPCAHHVGRFVDAPRVEYGSLRDLPALLSDAVRGLLMVGQSGREG